MKKNKKAPKTYLPYHIQGLINSLLLIQSPQQKQYAVSFEGTIFPYPSCTGKIAIPAIKHGIAKAEMHR